MGKKSKKKKNNKQQEENYIFYGLITLIISIIIFLSFITLNNKNLLGPAGELISRTIYFFIGKAGYLLPFIIGFYGINILKKKLKYLEIKYILSFIIFILSFSILIGLIVNNSKNEVFKLHKVSAFYKKEFLSILKTIPAQFRIIGNYKFYTAGIIGEKISNFLISWFYIVGAYIFDILLFMLSIILFEKIEILYGIGKFFIKIIQKITQSIIFIMKTIFNSIKNSINKIKVYNKQQSQKTQTMKVEKTTSENNEKIKKEKEQKDIIKEKSEKEQIQVIKEEKKAPPKKPVLTQKKGDYTLPPIDYLKQINIKEEQIDYTNDAKHLENVLKSFKIDGEVVNVVDGPVISRYELSLATGTKISQVESISTDIALAMGASQVRIAPIPDKSLLGIEIPKRSRRIIFLREIIESNEFQTSEELLTLAIGKDLGGRVILANLPDMPHLLIAGATGSGKSVCINSIIMSILYRATPDEVKLILIDPKRVELIHYQDIPHLITPVITDTKSASFVLKKLVKIMEDRYDILTNEGAKDIKTYNSMIDEYNKEIDNESTNEEEKKSKMPYIILIIDELADLMVLEKDKVEGSLKRLAQLARAVGIHLILATQRPSVDVITGVIKANFPSRIAFQVMSQVDSRTILDMKGAETLLGKGDMLYFPSYLNKPIRGQAAFVSTKEISKVVSFIKKQRKPEYIEEFQLVEKDKTILVFDDDETDTEELQKAIELAREKGEISISYLQRKLKIGYSKAARLIDEMEDMGLLSEKDGNKPRKYIGE